jgi:hypothetical protein
MGAESVTGGVRDTLAAAAGEVWDDGNATGLDGWVGPGRGTEPIDGYAEQRRARSVYAFLDALSSPEVVRVATEALTEHTGVRDWDDPQQIECCGIWRSPADHAAHQWSVLVAALRGER